MKDYKKILMQSVKINLIIYLIAYSCYCFVEWEIVFPFAWILDLKKWSPDDRFLFLFSVFVYYYSLIQVLKMNLKKAKT